MRVIEQERQEYLPDKKQWSVICKECDRCVKLVNDDKSSPSKSTSLSTFDGEEWMWDILRAYMERRVAEGCDCDADVI